MTSFTNSPKTGANSDIINWLDIHSVIDLLPWGERGRKYISRELCDLFYLLYLLFVATVCLDIITSSAPYRQIYHLPLDSYSFFNTSRGYIWKFYRPIIIINNLVVCPNHSVYEPLLQGAHLLARRSSNQPTKGESISNMGRTDLVLRKVVSEVLLTVGSYMS